MHPDGEGGDRHVGSGPDDGRTPEGERINVVRHLSLNPGRGDIKLDSIPARAPHAVEP